MYGVGIIVNSIIVGMKDLDVAVKVKVLLGLAVIAFPLSASFSRKAWPQLLTSLHAAGG